MDKAHLLYELNDAKGDMLKKLNVLTDLECPTFKDVEAMYLYSKSVKCLQEACNMAYSIGDDGAEPDMMAHAKVK